MTGAYESFAEVYDLFMEDVPYEKWADFVADYLKDRGIADGLVLDLACGTGTFTKCLKDRGYDMIGVECSVNMLNLSREKDPDILWLCQDMREFELYGTVRAVVCVCDSLNYITDEDQLLQVFRLVNNYLDPGGYFIFDLNTPYKYREVLAENTFAENREEAAFIWDNIYDEESCINEYELTLFKAAGNGVFTRSCELHYEKCYTLSQIKKLLAAAGMEFVTAFAGYEDIPMGEGDEMAESDRMVVVAREGFVEGKKYTYAV